MNRVFSLVVAVVVIASCAKADREWDATGSFEATEIVVSAEASGKILSLNLEEGDRVAAGEILGVIDTVQLYYKAKEIASRLKATDIRKPDIHKQIASLKSELSTVNSELARYRRLVAAEAGNQKSVDDIENKIALLNSQIEAQESSLSKSSVSADAEIESLQYQLMGLNDLLDKSNIRSSETGVVLIKYAQRGEMAVVGKPLFKLADLDILYLRAYITSDQLGALELGQGVEVLSDRGDSYQGEITWISEKSEFTPKGILTRDERANLVYAIKIVVRNDGLLKIGQYGEIKF